MRQCAFITQKEEAERPLHTAWQAGLISDRTDKKRKEDIKQ